MPTPDGLSRTTVVERDDGHVLGVREVGDLAGAPLLLLHGQPGSRLLHHPAPEYLARQLRVITYDRPGYGLSTRRPGRTVADAPADVAAIADALGLDRFAIAGISAGAPHALATAALLPERVHRCASIVGPAPLNARGLDFFDGMDAHVRGDWHHALDGEVPLERQAQQTVEWVRGGMPGLDLDGDMRDLVQAAFEEAFRPGTGGYVDDALACAREWGVDLSAVAASAFVMFARDDTTVPAAHARWLASRIPGATLIEVGGGHFGPRTREELRPARPAHR